ncbi:MAG: sugar ABC transporter permease [Saprospiraceae bacterium]|nr:MAG: sugar ABC transporter permease [Saprospiraceae bacterium]
MKKILIYSFLSLAAVTFLYPFYWMIVASLSPESEIGELLFLPSEFTLDSYLQMFSKIPIGRALLNSIFVATLTTGGVIVFSSMVGYALALMEFKGRNLIFYIIIFTMTLPFQITLIPNYITMVTLNLVDTYAALVLPFLLNAFAILLFRQAFLGIPPALLDAARVDGCSEFRILFQVLFPNIIPTIVIVGILTFMNSWNEVLWALIVIREENLMTMPQMVTLFSVGGRADSQLGVKLASAVLLALPIMIAYSFFQKYFIQSMASSGLKD